MAADRIPTLREMADRPVRIDRGRIFIGDEEFLYPVAEGSIKVEPTKAHHNRLTLTLVVGDVTVARRSHTNFPDFPTDDHGNLTDDSQ